MADAFVLITISAKDLASAVFRQIGVDAKAGLDKSVKGLEKYQESLEKTGKAATKMGKGLSIGVTAPLALFAGVAVNSAIKAERLTKTLESMAGGADKAASFIDAIKDASLGTVPQIEALEIANKALSFEVVKTEDEMASLVETAIVLGKAQGLDAATAVGDLTTALARQSPMILDNLGITLKLSEAYQIYADSLGVSVDSLDASQKKIAFQEAALIKGAEAAAKMGGMQEDMATQVERAKAELSDLTTTLGTSLIPMLQTGLGVITPVIEGFANMDAGTQKMVIGLAAVAAGLGPAIGAFGAATTAAGTFTAAVTAAGGGVAGLKAVLTGTTASLVAVGAAAIAVTGAYLAWQKLQDDVAEGQNKVTKATDDWTTKADEMIAAGMSTSDTMGTFTSALNDATDAMNEAGIISDVFVGETEIIQKALTQLNEVAIDSSLSYEDYTQAIEQHNEAVTDQRAKVISAAKAQELIANELKNNILIATEAEAANIVLGKSTVALTKEEFERRKVLESLVEADVGYFNDQREIAAALGGVEQQTLNTTEAIEKTAFAWDSLAEGSESSIAATEALRLETERETVARELSQQATMDHNEEMENSVGTVDMLALRMNEMAGAHTRAGGPVENLSTKLAVSAGSTERAASAAERQAASAQRQAEALENSRQAAIGAAEAQIALAGSLKDATDAQIASALIEQLDPEQLGATAYAEGVTAIQVAFGLADEKSIALAENIGPLADAMNDGIIPTEDFDEALAALIEDAADGEVNTGLLLDQFSKAPGLIGPSEEKLKSFNEKLVLTGEDAIAGEEGLINFGAAAEDIVSQVDGLTSSVVKLNDEMGKIGSAPVVVAPGGGGVTRQQFGGVVPGPIGGPPRLIIAEPGEVFTPPSQIGGPTNNFGGNTQTVIINNEAALGFFEEQQRFDRLSRLSANL